MQVWDVSRKEPLIALPHCMLIALPHCMQVWDVSRKEPKQLLGARKLGGDALNEFRSILGGAAGLGGYGLETRNTASP